jgi:hypothetical protein
LKNFFVLNEIRLLVEDAPLFPSRQDALGPRWQPDVRGKRCSWWIPLDRDWPDRSAVLCAANVHFDPTLGLDPAR